MTARQALPAWFTATSIEVALTGLIAEVTPEAEVGGLLSEVTVEARLAELMAAST